MNTFLATVARKRVATGGGGGPATFSDTFGYTENPISHGWASPLGTLGAIQTDSSSLGYAYGATAGNNEARVVTPTFADNQIATVTIFSSAGMGPCVRLDSNGNGYWLAMQSFTGLSIFKVTANGVTFTQLGSSYTVTTVTAGDTLGLSASGSSTTTLEVFRNGVSQGTRTDSSSPHTTGQPGIGNFTTNTSSGMAFFQADDL